MEKNMFPKGFLWGASTSAFQVEGGYNEGGKGLATTDFGTRAPGVADNKVAADHYHHWKEDVDLMAELGLKVYRMGFSWSRIMPDLSGKPNPEGLKFYDDLIDYLLEKGIEPLVTLYHFECPLAPVEAFRGWLDRRMVDAYEEYARVCFTHFKGRVVGLRTNGTCIATDPGKYCSSTLWDANRWTDVQELAAGDHHVVALRTDGTCVATSILSNNCYRNYGQCNVSSWTDITAIACGHYFTIGLKKDGTVVHAGENYAREVEQWEDIVLIAAGGKSAVGVTREGKVVSAGSVNIGAMERAENIVQLAITRACAYALQADGTVVGGRPDSYDPQKKKQVSNNALAIAGGFGLMILKEDGSVDIRIEATSQTPPSEYRLFESYESYLKEKIAAEQKFRARATQQKAYRDAGVCQHCGGAFKKSLFSYKCTKCGVKKDY